ncbi:hypothetical protein [Weissella sagaensis]|jgi:membrane protein implicated in regulation of membrane protease activity|uniref:Uncharacterized protein n=1 Tax=Weissella sagaensis TaxID=2559928 RepID=A0ABW1RTZ6_9LACO|nr:hypothetical protein [Weissella sagaensis]KAA8432829.1 hypothetical protein FKV79_07230 [Weissella paramesenteroides]MBU7568351.1 hypothetical protein [Weissella hellenica]KAA8437933.1 hypothetical protein FKV73_04445 [Weissella paramesenteroides]QDJ59115.1 hypothetical protein EFA59_06115 [Weissella hellenica]UEG67229.1 hypothetical protein GZH44_01565 [Weissella hellenica]
MRVVIQIGASVIVMAVFVGFTWIANFFDWPTWLIFSVLLILFILATGLMTRLSLALQKKKQEDKNEKN